MKVRDRMENSSAEEKDHLLQIIDLTKYFGGLSAVDSLNMFIKKGEILALIGPNGAGKTTVFNLITGFLRPLSGKLIYKGKDITNLKPHQKVIKGITRSFQANILFMDKTVRENVLLGFHCHYRTGFFKEVLHTKSSRKERAEIEGKTDELLRFMHLRDLKDQFARSLTHGYQRMLGMSTALASEPELLLLDEPVTGMNDEETEMMMELIKKIRKSGVTILFVEHDMKAVMGNCERIVVMDHGMKIAEGSPSEIIDNKKVIEAYLGTGGFDA